MKLSESAIWGQTIAFATMHEKEKILAPLFKKTLNADLIVPHNFNTDRFGTFSGEVSRFKDTRKVLRSKAEEGAKLAGKRFGLASEGAFMPHPWIPFVECNIESLMLVDLQENYEIYNQVISTDNRAHYTEAKSQREVIEFCERVGCGSQGLIVKPTAEFSESCWIFKGLVTVEAVIAAYQKITAELQTNSVWLETDNRAHLSPKRQKVILEAGEKLIEVLNSWCPGCGTAGFQMTDFIRGLPCERCGLKSNLPLEEIWSCPHPKCNFQQHRPRLDGLTSLDPGECSWCNP